MQLAVQKGDVVTVTAPGLYAQPVQHSFFFALGAFLAHLLHPAAPAPPSPEAGRGRPGLPLPQLGVAAGLPALLQLSGGVPRGYVRVLCFDRDSALVSKQTQQLSQAALNNYESLRLQVTVPQDGYVTAYVGNESDTDVLFDDVTIEHRQGLQVQETQYDPWGLSLAGLDYASPGLRGLNHYQFNGKEKQSDLGLGWSDYGARLYDGQLGRWHAVDPLAYLARRWSPYAYAYDSPTRYTDPDGMFAIAENASASMFRPDEDNNRPMEGILFGHNSVVDYFKKQSPFGGDDGYTEIENRQGNYLAGGPGKGKGKGKEKEKEDAPKTGDEPRLTLEDLKKGPPQVPGYVPPKSGHRREKSPNGPGTGWVDRNGDVWIPTDHKGTHAPHWEKQMPGRGYENVYPTAMRAAGAAAGTAAAGIILWEIIKWGAAAAAPETLGGSLAGAAALP